MNVTRAAGLSGAAALVGSIIALTAPATAAPLPDVYVHGTATMGSWASRAVCNRHAGAEVRLVTSHPKQAKMLAARPYFGYPDDSERMTCYPLQSGRWTYIVAYKALSGKPLNRADKLFPRYDIPTQDLDSFVAFGRYRAYKTVAKCKRSFNDTLAKVVDAPNRKLTFGTYPCQTFGPGVTAFFVTYMATSSTAGLRGDAPYPQTNNMLQNGWAPPYSPWY